MCDIKFWKDNENLRSVNKKPFFEILSSSQKISLSLLRDENFFSLNRSNGASKNPSFRTDFKNVHMTIVKSAPKKSFSQKTILPIENWKVLKNRFFGQIFLGALFTKVICTFLKSG
jgi:hypothetical protein